MTTPYTYLLRWTSINQSYYGVRYAENCQPEDLFRSYFTSSDAVTALIESVGMPDIIQIRRVFEDAESARQWEHKVLRRLKVVNSEQWVNKTDNKSFPLMKVAEHWAFGRKGEDHPLYNIKRPAISSQRKDCGVWVGNNNPMYNDDQKQRSIAARAGNNHHMKRPEVKEKISGKNNWIYRDSETLKKHKERIREMNRQRKGMKYERLPCLHCGADMPKNNIKRHEKLCKQRLLVS